ncbi:hypothetical protein R3W88_018673 [Solanum pinnatisectum]|uniref:Uncharacterized protein n=1 Tax=Solanum pinnatisectum TaxID=50273 RepID=A0AAV9KH33_9SOLN|nr:hypothetical protein R3W88_018673 [Solanum pinnatisectum]
MPCSVRGATRCVTPRQTCPRPNGFECNLRSKTRWFTGFCNSLQVSHFATFFIDVRAEISIVESRLCLNSSTRPPAHSTNGARGEDSAKRARCRNSNISPDHSTGRNDGRCVQRARM